MLEGLLVLMLLGFVALLAVGGMLGALLALVVGALKLVLVAVLFAAKLVFGLIFGVVFFVGKALLFLVLAGLLVLAVCGLFGAGHRRRAREKRSQYMHGHLSDYQRRMRRFERKMSKLEDVIRTRTRGYDNDAWA